VLRFEGVGFGYAVNTSGVASADQQTIISDVSFTIKPGEFVALLGENGAGKSTLCRLANGLLKPTAGTVFLADTDTLKVKTSVLARRAGYLFQNPDRQLCQTSVREEILFGLEYAFADGARRLSAAELEAEKQRRCDEMLALFGLDGNRDPFGLSRGERQQTALASVLARRPELLILDEPTTGLDYRECMTIMKIISDLHARGTTILMISHDMEVVSDFARRALVLSKGRLIGDGPVKQIMKNQALLEQASLLPAQIPALALSLGRGFEEVYTIDEMVQVATGTGRGAAQGATQ
jgi:energy-coupling factor transport system ATP-binding protein